jgi:hypothetical protein
MDWRCDSSDRAPALQVGSSEFNPTKKKKKKKSDKITWQVGLP